jgi:hypothetical protein
MPSHDRPELVGAELDLFDLLLSSHIRYMAHRLRCLDNAVRSGLSEARAHEIARMAIVYGAPVKLRQNLETVLTTIENLPATDDREEPS